MANTANEDKRSDRVTIAIRVMVSEADHQALRIKAAQEMVNLSEIGREFFLAWLEADPHANALVKRAK